MKIIALFPVKNDAWILRTTLPQLLLFSDEVVVLDGHSSDETKFLIESCGGTVLRQDGDKVDYSSWRRRLLQEARRRGGTHLVWLDADEAFTTVFRQSFRRRLADMKPGQKLICDWLCLWKDARSVRHDASLWSTLSKDFVFCDDGVSEFPSSLFHEGRTPGDNHPASDIRIPREEGAVLHFQFVPFQNFQMKQAFHRCQEWILNAGPFWQINEKYSITLDDAQAETRPMPGKWIEGLSGLDSLARASSPYYKEEIFGFFSKYGVEFFEPLAIWHIPSLKDEFNRRLGRYPKAIPRPNFAVQAAQRAYYKAKRALAHYSRG